VGEAVDMEEEVGVMVAEDLIMDVVVEVEVSIISVPTCRSFSKCDINEV
jgi:hypothetical protein